MHKNKRRVRAILQKHQGLHLVPRPFLPPVFDCFGGGGGGGGGGGLGGLGTRPQLLEFIFE